MYWFFLVGYDGGCNSLYLGLYYVVLDSFKYYMFIGGGIVLKVLEEVDFFGLFIVKVFLVNGEVFGY